MATYNVDVTQSATLFPANLAAGSNSVFAISNKLSASSYFVLETIPLYTPTTPKNTSGSFTVGSGLSGFQRGDYFVGVVVAPGGGNLTFVNAVPITGSTLMMKGMGSSR